MRSLLYKTVILSGKIGIVDAALVRYLERIKNQAEQVCVHVTGSVYDDIITKRNILEFVKHLRIVDEVFYDYSELNTFIERPGVILLRLPEEELQQYSMVRILKRSYQKYETNGLYNEKLLNVEQLLEYCSHNIQYRKINVGLVSGTFDLIHWGHVSYIATAKALVDILVVATMSTSSIKQQEKNVLGDRPIYSQEDRVRVLASLRDVDYIVVFDELDCKGIIKSLRPTVFVKHEKDLSRKIVQEECQLVESLGGEIKLVKNEVGYSSTEIITYVRRLHYTV